MPFAQVRGINLHYYDDDFADPWKAHDTIVLNHFVLGSAAEFYGWVPTLARDYRVIRLDRRGYGLSDKPPLGYEYSVDGFIEDFKGFLDQLGLEKVHYVGQSLGGMLGVYIAHAIPERLKTLTLVSAPCYINDSVKQGFTVPGYGPGPEAVMKLGSWGYSNWFWHRNRQPGASIEDILKACFHAEGTAQIPAHMIASIFRMVTAPSFDFTPILGDIKVPTLLLSPGAAPSAPLEEQVMIRNTIPDCEQVVFEDAPHLITFEQPEECARHLLEFVRRH